MILKMDKKMSDSFIFRKIYVSDFVSWIYALRR